MAFNPLQNFLSGQQAGQMQQAQDISGRLSQSSQPTLEPEFQRLLELDPARAKQIMDISAGGDAMRTNAMITDAKMAKQLLNSGNVDGARRLFENRLQALGDRAGEDTMEVYNDIINGQPGQALNKVNSFLSIFDPSSNQSGAQGRPTADMQNFEKLEELKRTGNQQQINSFSKMLGLTNDPSISSSLEKQIVKSQDDFFKFSEQARQMDVLASDIQAINIGGGLQSTLSETFKTILGSTEEVTALRQRFNAIRTSQATSNLPPGPASDKDIQMALSGFPKENANAETITSFLLGQKKLAKVNEKFAEFKADFFSTNKSPSGLIPAWKNFAQTNTLFEVGGDVNEAAIQADYDIGTMTLEELKALKSRGGQ
tara:strand:- start:706 stop:1818 length:1113 start_codon:yes stop_codon:yes gene_type:complete